MGDTRFTAYLSQCAQKRLSAARSFSERGLVLRLFSCVWAFGADWASCCLDGPFGGRAMHGAIKLYDNKITKGYFLIIMYDS